MNDSVTNVPLLLRDWTALRARQGRTEPFPEDFADRLTRFLASLGRWLSAESDEVDEKLRSDFQNFAGSFRGQALDIRATLDELSNLEDLLLGEEPSKGDAPQPSRKLRRVMRVLVAESVRLNQALDQRRHREDQDALRTFGDILSHELGNRLGAARTGVDLLLNPPHELGPEQRQEIISVIVDGIDAALTTVDDVTAYMEAQNWEEGTRISLPEIVRRVTRGISPLARHNNVELQILEPLPEITVEGARIRLILSNLLVNGVRYADRSKHERWVRLGADRHNAALRIEVVDNGVGISREDQERIFQFRERGDSSGPGDGGKGLGLAIVREAIQQLGGETRLESEPGTGSTFQVIIPLE